MALVALAALIGRKVAIFPKQHDDWLVVANLWAVLVGRTSAMKSPAMTEALRPLKRLAIEAHGRYEVDLEAFDVAQITNKAIDEDIAKEIRRVGKSKSREKIKDAEGTGLA